MIDTAIEYTLYMVEFYFQFFFCHNIYVSVSRNKDIFFQLNKDKKERKYGNCDITVLLIKSVRQIRYQTYSFFFFLIDNLRINLSCGNIFMS